MPIPESDKPPLPAPEWWERPWLLVLLPLLAGVPLLWPDVPPLVDLPGHMAAYKVQLDFAHSPELQRFYSLEWRLIGNLGVNLLVMPLAPLVGLEPAVKAIMIAVPVLTVAGLLWTARELHGRLPPTALFALPLAYNFPFVFGFANYTLSMALAFLALALWLRLGRSGRLRLRAALFVPISLILWVAHVYGWAFLCAVAGTIELVRRLPGLAVVRREAFSNDQWSIPGAQLLQTGYPPAGPFQRDPSHIVALAECPIKRWRRLDEALRIMPWDAFDYLWLIDPPAYDRRFTRGPATGLAKWKQHSLSNSARPAGSGIQTLSPGYVSVMFHICRQASRRTGGSRATPRQDKAAVRSAKLDVPQS
ncbi:MAG: hypothetical protein ACJ8ER_14600 [Allosphingosinicella sp.]